MSCEECKAKQKAIAASLATSLLDHARIFWHYGQIIPVEDRHKLARLLGQLVDSGSTDPHGGGKGQIRNEIADLLAEHEVQMIFRSKHKEIPYCPMEVT